MGKLIPIALQATGIGGPPTIRQSATRWDRLSVRGLKPDTLVSAIQSAEKGDTEDWADLAQFMARDHFVRAKIEDRILAITGSELVVEPAKVPGRERVAEQAAEFIRRAFSQMEEFESLVAHLIHGGEDIGWAGAFHDLRRLAGEWHTAPKTIEPRDIRFQFDWVPQVRTYDRDPHRVVGRWMDSREQRRDSWIWHIPTKLDRPTVAGDLMAVAWPWQFRRWFEIFESIGLEKNANPFVTGKVPPNAPAEVRDALQSALETLSADQVAVIEDGSSVEFLETARSPGDTWQAAIERKNREITIGLLGSQLNTDNTDTGSRSLGDSQFSTTILPRLTAIAKRAAATLERDVCTLLLRLNAHLFEGQIPPTPNLRWELVNDEPQKIEPAIVTTGLRLTQNEYRASVGLDALTAEQGGDAFVTPPAPMQMPGQQPAPAAPGVAASSGPFGQMTLPLMRRRTPTICDSQTRVAAVPFDS